MHRYVKTLFLFLAVLLTQCKDDCLKSDKCNLKPETGPCFAMFTRYYYDKEEKMCKPFTWGGCAGVVPFETLEECKKGCSCD